MIQYLLV